MRQLGILYRRTLGSFACQQRKIGRLSVMPRDTTRGMWMARCRSQRARVVCYTTCPRIWASIIFCICPRPKYATFSVTTVICLRDRGHIRLLPLAEGGPHSRRKIDALTVSTPLAKHFYAQLEASIASMRATMQQARSDWATHRKHRDSCRGSLYSPQI